MKVCNEGKKHEKEEHNQDFTIININWEKRFFKSIFFKCILLNLLCFLQCQFS